MEIEHIGYAVKNIQDAVTVFAELGFHISEVKVDELRNVNVAIAEIGGVKIELLSPIVGKRSPVDSYLKFIGNTPYHICYRVDDIWIEIETLQAKGFVVIDNPAESVPLGGNVAFLYSSEIGLVELFCEKQNK